MKSLQMRTMISKLAKTRNSNKVLIQKQIDKIDNKHVEQLHGIMYLLPSFTHLNIAHEHIHINNSVEYTVHDMQGEKHLKTLICCNNSRNKASVNIKHNIA